MAYNIIGYHHHYLDETARLYQHAYAVPDFEDRDGHTVSREIILEHTLRDSFIGVLAVDEHQEVIGLAWGYGTPTHNKRITEIVIKRMGKEWVENTFMVEAFAMHFEHHSPELARALHEGLIKRVQEDAYDRLRIRLNVPRLDSLTETLLEEGWRKLDGLAHVVWMGKVI